MKAFPCGEGIKPYEYGMDLRDYFAAKAMQGLMSGRWKHEYDAYTIDAEGWAKSAYAFADAMMKAREQ